jgi:hypothetical protein
MSTSLSGSFQLENAGNFESCSASASASALARGPLAAVTICDFFYFMWARDQYGQASQLIATKKNIEYWTWSGNACSTDMHMKELPAITGKDSASGGCILFDFYF